MIALIRAAADAANDGVGIAPTISVSSWSVLLVTSLIVPVIVGTLTKLNAPATLKVGVNIVLTAVTTLLVVNATADGGALISRQSLNLWVVSTLVSVASYLGFWQNVGGGKGINAMAAPNMGIGPSS